jgi:hypothetical protein
MEFVITKYGYYLPFKKDDGTNQGIVREHIKLDGVFLGSIETPNQSTRELIRGIKVGFESTTSTFNISVATDDELARLNAFEESNEINTTINLKATENSLVIFGAIYLSRISFEEMKGLMTVAPNSNSYFSFETIVYGDRVTSKLPLIIDLHSDTSGININFSIQQPKSSA